MDNTNTTRNMSGTCSRLLGVIGQCQDPPVAPGPPTCMMRASMADWQRCQGWAEWKALMTDGPQAMPRGDAELEASCVGGPAGVGGRLAHVKRLLEQ